jgi:hypothetical protein
MARALSAAGARSRPRARLATRDCRSRTSAKYSRLAGTRPPSHINIHAASSTHETGLAGEPVNLVWDIAEWKHVLKATPTIALGLTSRRTLRRYARRCGLLHGWRLCVAVGRFGPGPEFRRTRRKFRLVLRGKRQCERVVRRFDRPKHWRGQRQCQRGRVRQRRCGGRRRRVDGQLGWGNI